MCNRFCKKKLGGGGGVANWGGGFEGPLPRKFEICKLMCNRLRTLRIGWYAPVFHLLCFICPITDQGIICPRKNYVAL